MPDVGPFPITSQDASLQLISRAEIIKMKVERSTQKEITSRTD